jgi:hypothetical protein
VNGMNGKHNTKSFWEFVVDMVDGGVILSNVVTDPTTNRTQPDKGFHRRLVDQLDGGFFVDGIE